MQSGDQPGGSGGGKGGKNGKGGGPGNVDVGTGDVAFSVTKPFVLPGDLVFTTDASTVECSADAGATFTDCTANSIFSVTPAHYAANTTIVLRFKLGDATDEYRWKPREAHPGVTASDCDRTVLMSIDKATFEALWVDGASTSDLHVVCLADDVVVNGDPTAGVAIAQANFALVGSETAGHQSVVHRLTAEATYGAETRITGGTYEGGIELTGFGHVALERFSITGHNGVGLRINGSLDIDAVGLSIDVSNDNGASGAISALFDGTVAEFESCTIRSTGDGNASADAVYLQSNGALFLFRDSTIEVAASPSGAAVRAINNVSVVLNGGIVKSDAAALAAVKLETGNELRLSGVTLETARSGVVFAGGSNTLYLTNARFKHTGGTASPAIDLSATQNQTIKENGLNVKNGFCNVDGSTTDFTKILSDAPAGAGSNFDVAATWNGSNTSINDCSTYGW